MLGSRFQVFFWRDVRGVEGENAVGDGFDEVLFFFTVFAYGPERIVYVCLVDAYFDNKGDMIWGPAQFRVEGMLAESWVVGVDES